jgi:hypothetical protein
MTLAAVGIDQDGREVFLKQPDHRAALRALHQLADVLRVSEQPIEEPEDDLGRLIAELKAARPTAAPS